MKVNPLTSELIIIASEEGGRCGRRRGPRAKRACVVWPWVSHFPPWDSVSLYVNVGCLQVWPCCMRFLYNNVSSHWDGRVWESSPSQRFGWLPPLVYSRGWEAHTPTASFHLRRETWTASAQVLPGWIVASVPGFPSWSCRNRDMSVREASGSLPAGRSEKKFFF